MNRISVPKIGDPPRSCIWSHVVSFLSAKKHDPHVIVLGADISELSTLEDDYRFHWNPLKPKAVFSRVFLHERKLCVPKRDSKPAIVVKISLTRSSINEWRLFPRSVPRSVRSADLDAELVHSVTLRFMTDGGNVLPVFTPFNNHTHAI